MTMRSGNNRWTDFDIEASVDGERWDTIWRRRLDPDGFMNTNGEEILFAGVPFLELKNIEDGGVFGLGTAFALQADLTHMGGVTGVEYFANGLSLGTATEGPDYTLSWTPASAGVFTLTAVATFDSGTRTQATWFPVEITIDPEAGPPPVPARIAISPESFTVFTGGTLQLTAVVTDDDDQPIHPQPAFDWSVSPGGGSVDATGRFTAGTEAGNFTITASASFPDEPHSLSGTATVEVLPAPDLYLRIDFGTNHTAPGAGWNSVNPAASHSGLIHGITGEATAVVLDMINTGGNGIQSSSNTDAW
ncbi:MAG: Ig-like domain-containing protein, partial [Limnospira sp. PMC 1234.20]